MQLPLDVLLEGILFYHSRALTHTELCQCLDCNPSELTEAAQALSDRLQSGATRLLSTVTHLQLVTQPELGPFLDTIRRAELSRDIGKSGAETLAIVLYCAPVTRAQIDHIRGVNSTHTLRTLRSRGLVETFQKENVPHYQITPSLLQHLGVTKPADIPEYDQVRAQIEAFTHRHTNQTER